jgi:hypothetical protein
VPRKAFCFRIRPAAAQFYPHHLELSREAGSPIHVIGSWLGFTRTIPSV